jgi:hypothetical protein
MAGGGWIESGNSRIRRSFRVAGRFASMPHPEFFGDYAASRRDAPRAAAPSLTRNAQSVLDGRLGAGQLAADHDALRFAGPSRFSVNAQRSVRRVRMPGGSVRRM